MTNLYFRILGIKTIYTQLKAALSTRRTVHTNEDKQLYQNIIENSIRTLATQVQEEDIPTEISTWIQNIFNRLPPANNQLPELQRNNIDYWPLDLSLAILQINQLITQ
ncbi:13981_t:CDS:1, partial [Ambispora leptoticha]